MLYIDFKTYSEDIDAIKFISYCYKPLFTFKLASNVQALQMTTAPCKVIFQNSNVKRCILILI